MPVRRDLNDPIDTSQIHKLKYHYMRPGVSETRECLDPMTDEAGSAGRRIDTETPSVWNTAKGKHSMRNKKTIVAAILALAAWVIPANAFAQSFKVAINAQLGSGVKVLEIVGL